MTYKITFFLYDPLRTFGIKIVYGIELLWANQSEILHVVRKPQGKRIRGYPKMVLQLLMFFSVFFCLLLQFVAKKHITKTNYEVQSSWKCSETLPWQMHFNGVGGESITLCLLDLYPPSILPCKPYTLPNFFLTI